MADTAKYVVIENIPGYLPTDDEPATFTNIEEARLYAGQLAREAVASYAEIDRPVRKSGNARVGYHIVDPTDDYDLGVVIEVLPIEHSGY